MRAVCLFCAGLSAAAWGQSADVQRALIQRDQQSDAFAQQLRQSQERLRVAPGDLQTMQRIEARQLEELQRLQDLDARQLRSVSRDTPRTLRPYERAKAAAERRELILPPPTAPRAAPR